MDHADAQSLDVGVERDHAAGGRERCAIARSQRLEQDRAVLHRPAHQADMVETGRQRKKPAPVDQIIGRLQAGDSAQRGGAAHGAAGVGTDPAQDSPAATAAAMPLDEPPVKCSGFHGLRAGGHGKSHAGVPKANS